jgi:hypothetical protein
MMTFSIQKQKDTFTLCYDDGLRRDYIVEGDKLVRVDNPQWFILDKGEIYWPNMGLRCRKFVPRKKPDFNNPSFWHPYDGMSAEVFKVYS